MDANGMVISAGFRDARFAPRQLQVNPQADGALTLYNPTPIDDRLSTMTAALDHWAAAAPDRVWLAERASEAWQTLSYLEAQAQVTAIAGGLQAIVGTNSAPLLILARNGIDHALISYAAMSLGIPIAPMSPQYGLAGADPSRLTYARQLIVPGLVYVDDAALFAEALSAPSLASLPVITSRHPREGDIRLADLKSASPLAARSSASDVAKLLLTSGSTGKPKAVICTHRNITANAAQITACFDDPDPPVLVNGAPWSHSLGANAILHMVLHRGGTLYIDAGQPTAARFAETVRNLRDVPTTYHNMVPAGWALLAGELERDRALADVFFSRVRLLQYGGAAMPQSICDRIQAVAVATVGEKISFGSGYGATETGPTASNIHWPNDRAGLCGLPTPGTWIKLAPVGEKYELRVKGPQVSPGYFGRSDLTAEAFDADGFYKLGDAARLAVEDDPTQGLVFDGRLVENFKLASGTFVAAGSVRIAALSAIGSAAMDAIVCGEGEAGIGLMIFANPAAHLKPDAVHKAVEAGLMAMNASAASSGAKVARALVLNTPPDPVSGEITDKGYINQALARSRRPSELARLFADPPDSSILIFA